MVRRGEMKDKLTRIIASVGIGCAMIHFGSRALDVRLELFWGLSTYSLAWITTIFILPFVTGWVIGWVYGIGAKIVAHFPPLIVFGIGYLQTLYIGGVPKGAHLMPLGWWGLYVLLTMEFCAFGAFFGEYQVTRAKKRRMQADTNTCRDENNASHV